jgi:TRAP-type mannitol/chloroaromatic compound transport system substrate-binding protein
LKNKSLLIITLALVLAVTLMTACAGSQGTSPTEKAFKPETWQTATWVPSGILYDAYALTCDEVTKMSDGRLTLQIVAPGATVPVDQALDAVANGTAEMMSCAPSYYAGKDPYFFLFNDSVGIPRTIAEERDLYESAGNGKITQLADAALAKFGNVVRAGNYYYDEKCIIVSTVPINGINDIKGLKFRCAGLPAPVMSALGAGTVWFPGTEIYTSLSTGVVDACTYDSVTTMKSMSLHEVSKYWIAKPLVGYEGCDLTVVNGDKWEALPADIQTIVKTAIENGVAYSAYTNEIENSKSWKFVKDYGIQVIEWSDADANAYAQKIKEVIWAEYYTKSADCAAFLDTLDAWAKAAGYF